MRLAVTINVQLLLSIIPLVVPGRCNPITNEGFIYPPVSNPSIPDVFNVTIYDQDSIIIEYNKFPHTTAIGIEASCYNSVEDAVANENYSDSDGSSLVAYENTGKVSYGPISFYTTSIDDHFCRFKIFNQTISSCIWGPWGLLTRNMATGPVFYSPIFRVAAYDKTRDPVLWFNTQQTTISGSLPSKTVSLTVDITCPPSGIPPMSPTLASRQTDIWPPMAENVLFPG